MNVEDEFIKNEKLIFTVLNSLNYDYRIKEDLIQEGRIGLLSAIKHYDSSKSVAFSTYAYKCIKSAILNALNTAYKTENIFIDDVFNTTDFAVVEDFSNNVDDLILLQDCYKKMSKQEQDLISNFFLKT